MLQARLITFRPPRIAMFLVALAAAAHVLAPLSIVPPQRLAAALVGTVGFAIMLRAWWLFRSAGTPICPTEQASTLVTGDVFTMTRNPMYLGMVMMLLAIALFAGTASFYAAAVLNFLILNFVFCPYEERRLRATFDDYDNYAARVRRWL